MVDVLPSTEVHTREVLEAQVRASERAAEDWVLALLELHDRKLYKATHSSWDDYVLETFGYSHSTATRWLAQGREIAALGVGLDGKPAGQDRPRAAAFLSQRSATKAQQTRRGVIPASSAEAAQIPGEHATAGSGLALAGSPGTSSEGGERDGETRPAPGPMPPSGPSSEGVDAGTAPGLRPPTASGQLLEGAGRSPGSRGEGVGSARGPDASPVPSGPNSTERPLSDRQLAHRVVAAMRDVDPDDAGPRFTPEEATFLGQWTERTLHAWRGTQAAAPTPPARQSGYIIRPEDRQAAATLAAAQTAAAAPAPRPSPMASVRASLAGEVATIRPADCGHPVGQRLGDTCMACGKTL